MAAPVENTVRGVIYETGILDARDSECPVKRVTEIFFETHGVVVTNAGWAFFQKTLP